MAKQDREHEAILAAATRCQEAGIDPLKLLEAAAAVELPFPLEVVGELVEEAARAGQWGVSPILSILHAAHMQRQLIVDFFPIAPKEDDDETPYEGTIEKVGQWIANALQPDGLSATWRDEMTAVTDKLRSFVENHHEHAMASPMFCHAIGLYRKLAESDNAQAVAARSDLKCILETLIPDYSEPRASLYDLRRIKLEIEDRRPWIKAAYEATKGDRPGEPVELLLAIAEDKGLRSHCNVEAAKAAVGIVSRWRAKHPTKSRQCVNDLTAEWIHEDLKRSNQTLPVPYNPKRPGDMIVQVRKALKRANMGRPDTEDPTYHEKPLSPEILEILRRYIPNYCSHPPPRLDKDKTQIAEMLAESIERGRKLGIPGPRTPPLHVADSAKLNHEK